MVPILGQLSSNKKSQPKPGNPHSDWLMAEGVGFEPTDRLNTDQTISSRSRYDHFDNPPYSLFGFTFCDSRARMQELDARTKQIFVL